MVSLSYAQRLSVTVRMLLVGLLLMAMSMVEAQTTSAVTLRVDFVFERHIFSRCPYARTAQIC